MLDTVLPLAARDLARFRILRRSLRAFFQLPGTWWVVVPDRDFGPLSQEIAGHPFVVLPESRVVPEFERVRVRGWNKQQLIKLAMAEHVRTDYYLTLDADVIIARPVQWSDFFVAGRALCHRYPGKVHQNWNRWAQRVLRLPRSRWVHGVTPVLLSRDGVRSLAAYLDSRWPRPGYFWHTMTVPLEHYFSRHRPATPRHDGFASGRWRKMLLASLPWTEYSLYFAYLEATDQFDRYHEHTSHSLYGPSVWRGNTLDHWDLRQAGIRQRPFLIVQSKTGIPAELVAKHVEQLFAA